MRCVGMKTADELVQEIIDDSVKLVYPPGTGSDEFKYYRSLTKNARIHAERKRTLTMAIVSREHFYSTLSQEGKENIIPELDKLLKILIDWRISLE